MQPEEAIWIGFKFFDRIQSFFNGVQLSTGSRFFNGVQVFLKVEDSLIGSKVL